MARGGARNRSGPAKSETSTRSDRLGYSLQALPAQGYDGPVPKFPLPRRQIRNSEGRLNETATRALQKRELALWAWLWTTPQACAWSMPSQSWRLMTIAMYVRTFVVCESDGATAADKGSLHRFADQIGMTTAGLTEMGWKVAVDELAQRRDDKPAADDAEVEPPRRQRRLRDAAGDQ